jgi:hypothetical protein
MRLYVSKSKYWKFIIRERFLRCSLINVNYKKLHDVLTRITCSLINKVMSVL